MVKINFLAILQTDNCQQKTCQSSVKLITDNYSPLIKQHPTDSSLANEFSNIRRATMSWLAKLASLTDEMLDV